MSEPRYSSQTRQRVKDIARVEKALAKLNKIEMEYGDVVIFDTITLVDVAEVEMPVYNSEPVPAKDIYTREELLAALKVLKDSPCANVSEAIYLAVLDYRQQKQSEPKTNQE